MVCSCGAGERCQRCCPLSGERDIFEGCGVAQNDPQPPWAAAVAELEPQLERALLDRDTEARDRILAEIRALRERVLGEQEEGGENGDG